MESALNASLVPSEAIIHWIEQVELGFENADSAEIQMPPPGLIWN